MARRYQITVDGNNFEVDLISRSVDAIEFSIVGVTHKVQIAAPISPLQSAPLTGTGVSHAFSSPTISPVPQSGGIVAPMPGIVTKVLVSVGDSVSSGQTLMVIEAMKMENSILSTKSGRIKALEVVTGSEVKKNQLLVIVE